MKKITDPLRAAIVQHLFQAHENAQSTGNPKVFYTELLKTLKPMGYTRREIDKALTSLMEEGWIRHLPEG